MAGEAPIDGPQIAKPLPSILNANFLFASLVLGSVGLGSSSRAKKRGSWIPMVGGVLMMAASYFFSSALLMSLVCLGLIAAVYLMLKSGY